MATSVMSSHYTPHYREPYRHAPPSPPMDDSRCSLPSISNLLGLADAGSPTGEVSPISQHNSPRFEARGQLSKQVTPLMKSESRPGSSHARVSHHRRGGLPPTPPMGTEASFDSHHSPTVKLFGQVPNMSTRGHFYETTPPLETDLHRPRMGMSRAPRESFPDHTIRHAVSTTTCAPSQTPMHPYYQPPMQTGTGPQSQHSGLVYQRPLPQNFPPLAIPVSYAPSSGANMWQHHHYMSPLHGSSSYPPTQDRYICQTCNKAFSRPSSLRIHSHSHTGEKPFKCPHGGCGKAFSVRSNMKRHERGCHGFDMGAGSAPILS